MRLMSVLTVALVTVTAVFAEDKPQEPARLTSMRNQKDKRVQAATVPILREYYDALDDLKKRLGASGDAAGALLVQKEMDTVKLLAQSQSEARREIFAAFKGTWVMTDPTNGWSCTWDFKDDGSIVRNCARDGVRNLKEGNLKIIEVKNNTMTIGGIVVPVPPNPDGMNVKRAFDGRPFRYKKAK